MGVFDDALAELHAAADDVFGVAASFVPQSGAAAPCIVERFLPEASFAYGQASAVVCEATLKVLKAPLPKRPAKDDRFVIGQQAWRVLESAAGDDDDGLRYTVKVERA